MHEDGEGIRLGGHSLLNTADEAILHVIVDDPNNKKNLTQRPFNSFNNQYIQAKQLLAVFNATKTNFFPQFLQKMGQNIQIYTPTKQIEEV